MSAATATPAKKEEKTGLLATVANNARQYGIVGALLVIVVAFEVLTGGVLLKPNSFVSLIQQNAYVIILAIGMVMVIIATHIDLSVGSLVAFIGGAQIDPYGNVNSTCIFGKGDYLQPTTRFTGSGGANGIATYCNTIIMMQHQKRRFMDHVDYITTCGWMDGPGGRERAGLPGNRGPQMVVTDLGIMKFDEETKRMYLAYYYPFSSPEMVQENTGFEIDVSRAELMEGHSPEIILLIREEIDPGQAFIKVPKDK